MNSYQLVIVGLGNSTTVMQEALQHHHALKMSSGMLLEKPMQFMYQKNKYEIIYSLKANRFSKGCNYFFF
jgi:hypothetical protein